MKLLRDVAFVTFAGVGLYRGQLYKCHLSPAKGGCSLLNNADRSQRHIPDILLDVPKGYVNLPYEDHVRST